MKLHSLIIDDWFEDFDGWRHWADTLDFVDTVNPADGVTYPGIHRHVPTWGTQQRLQAVLQMPVTIHTAFLRLSLAGVEVPHQAHSDSIMGAWSLMVYLNRAEHCQGGTSLVRHCTGLDATPGEEAQRTLWARDTNVSQIWTPYTLCEMRPNRAFIFRSELMHRAEPVGGFGNDARNGRLVFTAFFS